jgi:uncharacterized protein
MNFKEINIEDKLIMDKYLKSSKYGNCEYSFTNTFIWKHIYKVHYTIHKNSLVMVSFMNKNKPKFLMPLSDTNTTEIINDMISYCEQNNYDFKMTSLSYEMISDLKEIMPNKFNFIENDLYDYIYSSEDLIQLGGKKYSSKRNHIKKFDKTYDYKYINITESNVQLCNDMLLKWCETLDCEEESLKAEIIAVKSALSNITALELIGGGITVNDKLIAFTLGQPINDDTFNVHIEKAFTEYHGSYAKINNEFAIRNLSDYIYVNREEDLGVEGLRKAKQSYNPIKLFYKNDAVLKV